MFPWAGQGTERKLSGHGPACWGCGILDSVVCFSGFPGPPGREQRLQCQQRGSVLSQLPAHLQLTRLRAPLCTNSWLHLRCSCCLTAPCGSGTASRIAHCLTLQLLQAPSRVLLLHRSRSSSLPCLRPCLWKRCALAWPRDNTKPPSACCLPGPGTYQGLAALATALRALVAQR